MLLVLSFAGLVPASAAAQGGPIDDAAPNVDASASAVAAPIIVPPATAPTPSASGQPSERPVRGPALRERAGRRSRGASTASGVLMMTILLGALGFYVAKRLRR